MNATITIASVDSSKTGVSKNNKPWRLYKVIDQSGNSYSTFDGGLGQQAAGAVGQVVEIDFEQTEKGRDLKALRITGNTPAPQAPPAKTPDGSADWDLIGLRKTRCALWAALLSSDTIKGMPAQAAATFGRELVLAAEIDIFHRDPAQPGEDIPFMWLEAAPNHGVHHDPWRRF